MQASRSSGTTSAIIVGGPHIPDPEATSTATDLCVGAKDPDDGLKAGPTCAAGSRQAQSAIGANGAQPHQLQCEDPLPSRVTSQGVGHSGMYRLTGSAEHVAGHRECQPDSLSPLWNAPPPY